MLYFTLLKQRMAIHLILADNVSTIDMGLPRWRTAGIDSLTRSPLAVAIRYTRADTEVPGDRGDWAIT